MEKEITFFLATNVSPEMSNLVVWDALKAYLRGQIISYTIHMRTRYNKECLNLAHQISEVDKQYAQTKNLRALRQDRI